MKKHALYDLFLKLGLSTEDSFEFFHKGVRDSGAIDAYRCRRSGAIMLSDINQGGVEKYKSNADFNYWKSLGNEDVAKIINTDDRRRVEQFLPILQGKSCLDFGAGAGGFVRLAKDKVASIQALEIQPGPRAFMNEQGIKCYASLDEMPDSSYDVITSFHVLEHITNPVDVLGQLVKKLRPGGRLVVEVPHANDILLGLFGLDSFKKFTLWSEHLILHSRLSLQAVLGEAGFKVLSVEGHQRYSLANHLHWLSKNAPGGHAAWNFLDDAVLADAYAKRLMAVDMTDTLIAHCERA